MHLHLFIIQRAILDTHKSSLQSLSVEHSSGTDLASDENGIPGYMHVCFVSTTTSKHEGYRIGGSRNQNLQDDAMTTKKVMAKIAVFENSVVFSIYSFLLEV
jgi:hypothetical protein